MTRLIANKSLPDNLEWFREARFGLFIHFGLYSLLGRGEWVQYDEKIPRQEYEKLARRFNPSRFDADEWVRAAERAGARYLVLTTKHHDGFCLFDSNLTDFKITNTPFQRDLVQEMVDACHRRKMRIVLYYSQPDWHHPSFVHRPGAFKDLPTVPADQTPDWPAYLHYLEGQVEELCTRYGRIDGIWFDGCHKTEAEWRGRRLYRLIKKHQPDAVVNERSGYGDFFTPERGLAQAPAAAGYMLEACQSISRDAWGYQKDTRLYGAPYLIESLARMAGWDGNYLLNIGPKPDGSLPSAWVKRLDEIGDWLRGNGQAIYNTRGCPHLELNDDIRYTQSGRRLWVHVLRGPHKEATELPHLHLLPSRARILASKHKVHIEKSGGKVWLHGLPAEPPPSGVACVELLFADDSFFSPSPSQSRPVPYRLAREKAVLTATNAVRRGFGPKGRLPYIDHNQGDLPVFRGWTSPAQHVEWRLQVDTPGNYSISVELGCCPRFAGSTFTVKVAGHSLPGTVPATGAMETFQKVKLGRVVLPAGRVTIVMIPNKLTYGYVFAALRCLTIEPEIISA